MIRHVVLTVVVANLGEAAIFLVYSEPARPAAQLVLWVGMALALIAPDLAKP